MKNKQGMPLLHIQVNGGQQEMKFDDFIEKKPDPVNGGIDT